MTFLCIKSEVLLCDIFESVSKMSNYSLSIIARPSKPISTFYLVAKLFCIAILVVFLTQFFSLHNASALSCTPRRVVGRVVNRSKSDAPFQPENDDGNAFSCGGQYATVAGAEANGALVIYPGNDPGKDSDWSCVNGPPFYERRAVSCGQGPHVFRLNPPPTYSCATDVTWSIEYPLGYDPPEDRDTLGGVTRCYTHTDRVRCSQSSCHVCEGKGCLAEVYLGPISWDNHLQWFLTDPVPTPPPIPECAPYLASPLQGHGYTCNPDNQTATVVWQWTPTPEDVPASKYLLQVAFDRDFTNIDTSITAPSSGTVVGAINQFTKTDVNNPGTLRFSRVKVLESAKSCPDNGVWGWSNIVVSWKNCAPPPPDNGGGGTIKTLDKFFCSFGGQPTNKPDSGKIFSAIGCIPANEVQAFTRFMLTWGAGIAGGITLLMIVYAGFLYMTSGGNPQKVQAGKELFTAAVGGVFFLIFSAFMLRLIGSDIFNIPGL